MTEQDYGELEPEDLSYNGLGEYAQLLSFAAQDLEAHTAGDVPVNVAERVNEYLEKGLIEWTDDPEKVNRVDPDAERVFYLTQRGRRTIEEGVGTEGSEELRYTDIRSVLGNGEDDILEGVEE